MTLEEARQNVGQGVVYNPPGTRGMAEDGTIVRVSGRWVFVRYSGHIVAKATHPTTLTLAPRLGVA